MFNLQKRMDGPHNNLNCCQSNKKQPINSTYDLYKGIKPSIIDTKYNSNDNETLVDASGYNQIKYIELYHSNSKDPCNTCACGVARQFKTKDKQLSSLNFDENDDAKVTDGSVEKEVTNENLQAIAVNDHEICTKEPHATLDCCKVDKVIEIRPITTTADLYTGIREVGLCDELRKSHLRCSGATASPLKSECEITPKRSRANSFDATHHKAQKPTHVHQLARVEVYHTEADGEAPVPCQQNCNNICSSSSSQSVKDISEASYDSKTRPVIINDHFRCQFNSLSGATTGDQKKHNRASEPFLKRDLGDCDDKSRIYNISLFKSISQMEQIKDRSNFVLNEGTPDFLIRNENKEEGFPAKLNSIAKTPSQIKENEKEDQTFREPCVSLIPSSSDDQEHDTVKNVQEHENLQPTLKIPEDETFKESERKALTINNQNQNQTNNNGENADPADDDNEEMESDSSAEEVPLFEQPDMVAAGSKRRRKSTVRLNDEIKKSEAVARAVKSTWEAPKGIGTALLYHQKVATAIKDMDQNKKYDDLKVIYKFLYNSQCKKTECRTRILKFKGLDFTSEDKDADFKHQEVLGLFTNKNLKWAMSTLGVPTPCMKEKMVEAKDDQGNVIKDDAGDPKLRKKMVPYDKDDMIESCMAWLYVPKPVKPKLDKNSKKRVSISKSSEPKLKHSKLDIPGSITMPSSNSFKSPKVLPSGVYQPAQVNNLQYSLQILSQAQAPSSPATASSSMSSSLISNLINISSDNSTVASSKLSNLQLIQSLAEPSKNNSITSCINNSNNNLKNKNSSSPSSLKTININNGNIGNTNHSSSIKVATSTDSINKNSNFNETELTSANTTSTNIKPKAKPRPPTPSKLKAYIHRILKKANLEEVTMKNVCNQVYDRWPEFRERMVSRKSEIKMMVKEYIANT